MENPNLEGIELAENKEETTREKMMAEIALGVETLKEAGVEVSAVICLLGLSFF